MRTTNTYITAFLCSLFLLAVSCRQEEVAPFSADRGVNFVKYDTLYKEYKDDYANLEETYNFFRSYVTDKGWTATEHVFAVGIQLEGRFSSEPIEVKCKLLPVEGYDMPEVTLPDKCVIAPKESRGFIHVVCKKPAVFDREYKARLVFDYAASGLVAGTKERQEYLITLSDASDWKLMNVSDEEEWNKNYAKLLGNYGPMKARFILVTFGKLGYPGYQYSYEGIGQEYAATRQGNGFNGFMQKAILNYYLEAYKTTNGKPLSESDGTPVKFNF